MHFAISTLEAKCISNEDYSFLGCDAASLGKWFLILEGTLCCNLQGSRCSKRTYDVTELGNIRNHWPSDMPSHPRRLKSTTTPM
jgi:hypothetical protein